MPVSGFVGGIKYLEEFKLLWQYVYVFYVLHKMTASLSARVIFFSNGAFTAKLISGHNRESAKKFFLVVRPLRP